MSLLKTHGLELELLAAKARALLGRRPNGARLEARRELEREAELARAQRLARGLDSDS